MSSVIRKVATEGANIGAAAAFKMAREHLQRSHWSVYIGNDVDYAVKCQTNRLTGNGGEWTVIEIEGCCECR